MWRGALDAGGGSSRGDPKNWRYMVLAGSWFGVGGGGRPPAGRPLLSLVPCVAGSEPFGPRGSYSKNTVYAACSHTRLQGTGSGVLAKGVLAGLKRHRVGRGGVFVPESRGGWRLAVYGPLRPGLRLLFPPP